MNFALNIVAVDDIFKKQLLVYDSKEPLLKHIVAVELSREEDIAHCFGKLNPHVDTCSMWVSCLKPLFGCIFLTEYGILALKKYAFVCQVKNNFVLQAMQKKIRGKNMQFFDDFSMDNLVKFMITCHDGLVNKDAMTLRLIYQEELMHQH